MKQCCAIIKKLQRHIQITKWRSRFQESGSSLLTPKQPTRGLSVIQQNHHQGPYIYLDRTVCTKQIYNFRNIQHVRKYSKNARSGRQPNFFSQFFENVKQEMAKNKEMKENLRKFREEAEKLEQSEALKKARAKYMTVEGEASLLKAKLEKVKDTVSGVIEEASKSEIAKKAGKLSEEIGKSARDAAESLTAKGQKIGDTDAFKTITEATAVVRDELEQSGSQARVYVSPIKLRKRLETPDGETRVYAADATTMDIELHKDSKFYESWQNFKNNNPYVNKILDWKLKYEESENPMIRLSRLFTDKVTYIMGGIFQNTELSETLTEIVKVDPGFTKAKFLHQCETDIIPNILEAMVRGDLDILRDWCHDGPYNLLSQPIKQIKAMGGKLDSKILDIEGLDLTVGKIMDQGPVLIITFTCQQIQCVRDKNNKVIDGDPQKVMRVNYVWALSRDKSVLDPKAAWRLLDISYECMQQLV
ncbi:import inner membrane translocase subunit TIM44, putative [Pediculus humanus corporis]|uniref:Mitochondrial import inner membrane translocase subunit TIM44 n=1 Tax=Pediculus humanus subsp. corporis TaxID=121224 RepID=E0VLC7_PEDHC|nr:import inner membrane translocase subunit TIM44, putative [Pediculus humanus corporis]EEB14183.1 import inner membrane translocase subunit TIM44, putative [Pediculus humanus corporis]